MRPRSASSTSPAACDVRVDNVATYDAKGNVPLPGTPLCRVHDTRDFVLVVVHISCLEV